MYDSMVFYRSFYEAIKRLPEDIQGKLYDAVFAYGLDGEEVELEGIEDAMFQLIKPQIDANNKRKEVGRENGKKGAEFGKLGGRPKKKPLENPQETPKKPLENPQKPPNVNVNANVNVNDNVIKENISPKGDIQKKSYRFSPPTIAEVKSYCQEKGYTVDADRFVSFYESKGWYVGKNKMKDWKSAVRGWASRDRSEKKPQTTKFSNFHERKYDDATMLSLIEM